MTILRLRRLIRHRAAAWLALASMVLNTAWPLLANAKPSVPDFPSEICSATGLNHADDGAPAAPDKGLRCPHCTLCLFHAERGLAVPSAAQPLLPPTPRPIALAPVLDDAPRADAALHPAALPRGPPVLS